MDRRHDASLSDTDLDRLLADALDVEPSAQFRAHVHARIAQQRPSRFWPLVRLGIPAVALAAMLVAAVVLWREAPAPTPALDILAARSLAVEWSPLRASASAADPVASDVPRRPAARTIDRAASPTVLISASEAAALRRLLAGAAGFAVVSSTVDDARAPVTTMDIAITPISIDPIFAGSPAEGKQP